MDDKVRVTRWVGFATIITFFLLFSLSGFGGAPSLKTLSSYSVSKGAGLWDTTVITNMQLQGDSCGILVEINQDSCNGNVKYNFLSPNGYGDSLAYANYPVALVMPVNGKGNFSGPILWRAGTYKATLYVHIKNAKATTQTIGVKVYQINWR